MLEAIRVNVFGAVVMVDALSAVVDFVAAVFGDGERMQYMLLCLLCMEMMNWYFHLPTSAQS